MSGRSRMWGMNFSRTRVENEVQGLELAGAGVQAVRRLAGVPKSEVWDSCREEGESSRRSYLTRNSKSKLDSAQQLRNGDAESLCDGRERR